MASLIIISWRDIPAQVIVKRGRDTAKVQLSQRFQEAVDRAAMRAGKGSSDAYLADWARSTPRIVGEDLQAEASAEAARLEAKFTDADLDRLIRAKGLEANLHAAGGAGTPTADASAADEGAAPAPDAAASGAPASDSSALDAPASSAPVSEST